MTDHDPITPSSEEVLRWLVTRGLPGRSSAWVPTVGETDVERLVADAESARLLGPLQDAVVTGDLELSDRFVELVVERHAAVMGWCVRLEARLLEVRSWLDRAGGAAHRVLKGPAVAHLDEADPAMRSFADLDLLVAADDLDRVVRVLEAEGAVRPWPQRRPGFDRRFAKSVTLTCTDGIEIDVHRSLCDGVHGVRIPLDQLFVQEDHFDLGGERVPALTAPHRMLHAAYHAVLGSPSPRLMSLRDLARYMTRTDLSPEVVVPISREWRGEAVLAVAVDATTTALDIDVPAWSRWSARFDESAHEAAIIAAQRRDGSSFGRGKLGVLRALPGVRGKLAYGWAVAWPSDAHLAARGLRRVDVVRSLVDVRRSATGRPRSG